jgi:hypothetical protein
MGGAILTGKGKRTDGEVSFGAEKANVGIGVAILTGEGKCRNGRRHLDRER